MIKLTFLGTGTSTGIPVIGCSCDVCRSSDQKDKRLRSSVYIETTDTNLIIDTGPDLRQQLLRNGIGSLDAVLLTHEHYDHVGGLDDVRTIGSVPVYAESNVVEAIKRNMPYCFSEKRYPGVPRIALHSIETYEFNINQTKVKPIRVMHFRLPVLGFRIGNIAYLTDVKTIPDSSFYELNNLDILVINALRHEDHIAHLTLKEAVEMAEKIAAKRTFFTHFSHDLGKHEIVSLNLPASMKLAYDGLVIQSEE